MDRHRNVRSSKGDLSGWISLTKLLELKIEKVDMLWDPFLQQVGLAGIAGASDCGKSTLVRALCIAIALGKNEFLQHPLHPRYRQVYYVATEDTVQGIAAALYKQSLQNPEIENASGINFLFSTQDIPYTVEEALKNRPADLVVIDAWADVFSGNSNSLNDVRRDFNPYRAIAQKYNCLILIIHHLVKNYSGAPDKNKINGSQAIEAATRSFLELRNGDSYKDKRLTILKGNYASSKLKEQSLVLDFDEESLSFTNRGEIRLFSDYIQANKRKFNRDTWVSRMREIREKTGLSYEKARDKLQEQYANEQTPAVSWFKTHAKDDIPDGLDEGFLV